DGPSLTAFTDKARVERILGNLLDNAFDHGEGRAVRVRISREGERCLVGVSDEGPGLDRRDAARIFDRFYKADASRTRERGGVGLGLAIASQNAGLLGGTIDVISSPGAGATFVLKIPVGAREPAEVSG
ncbi:MAG TPA: ATP-binding protein, partial [Actinomycetota bacterium]|nr:ATP-binding protein [Actinomycetota bacterium]